MKFDPGKWYFENYVFVIGFLIMGPFILPLAWINPRYKLWQKAAITIAIAIISWLVFLSLEKSIKSIYSYYEQIRKLYKL